MYEQIFQLIKKLGARLNHGKTRERSGGWGRLREAERLGLRRQLCRMQSGLPFKGNGYALLLVGMPPKQGAKARQNHGQPPRQPGQTAF